MEKIFNLHFDIGNNGCVIVGVSPYQTRDTESAVYYEHNHHYFEIHCVKQGSFSYRYGKNVVTVDADSLLLLPPQTYHKFVDASLDCMKMSISFKLDEENEAADTENAIFYNVFGRIYQPIVIESSDSIKKVLSEISVLANVNVMDFLSREKLKVACNSFILQLFEILPNAKREVREKSAEFPPKEYIIDNYFAMNFSAKGSKEELASLLHISPRQLQRILLRYYGKNYRELQKDIRLKVSQSFLTDSDKTISEIAELMGYGSPENFATFIKKETGLTPFQIRRKR